MLDRAGAHRTRLQRYIKLAAAQSIVADLQGRRAQGHDFGMGCRIVSADRLVVAGGEHLAVSDQHCTHWYFAG